jgi:hypothetical protein
MRALSLILLLAAIAHADPSPSPSPSPQPVSLEPPPQARTEPPARGRVKRIAGVVTTLAGAAFIVAAAALGNQATTDSDAVTLLFASGGVWNSQSAAVEKEAKKDVTTMEVLYPIGGALMIAGITTAIIGWWQDKHPEKQSKVSITPIQRGAAATWSVSF